MVKDSRKHPHRFMVQDVIFIYYFSGFIIVYVEFHKRNCSKKNIGNVSTKRRSV
jgi:hypothetical protein